MADPSSLLSADLPDSASLEESPPSCECSTPEQTLTDEEGENESEGGDEDEDPVSSADY